jgi:signal transduction histidine kinase
MESGAMQLKIANIDAAALITRATSQIASLASNKKLSLKQQIAPDLPTFHGDEGKLRRVLVNLMGNAVKFTPPGGILTTSVSMGDSQMLLFSVSDTGEGIPAGSFERIFEKFGQVQSRQGGRVMSTGLGLTFCKLAVEAHGGAIDVESTPNQGSTFSFTIPLVSASVAGE